MAGFIVAVLALSACQAPNNGAKPNRVENQKVTKNAISDWNPQPRSNIRDGGTLSLAIPAIPNQLNLWHHDSPGVAVGLWGWYNPILTYYSPEGDWYYDKNYLVKVEDKTDSTRTTVTYTLRPEAKFNDGSPIDWRAFETAWKVCGISSPDSTCVGTDGYKLIENVTKGADDKQVVVTFKTVFPWWKGLFGLIMHPAMINPEVFNKGYVGGNLRKDLGGGPFKISNIDTKDGTITILPNELWWGDKPKLEKIVFYSFEDNASINAFRNGQLDAVSVGNKEYLAQVNDLADIEVRKGSAPEYTELIINGNSQMLSDAKIRKAICDAIDRRQIQEVVFDGLEFSETPPGSLLMFPFQKGYRDNWAMATSGNADTSNKILDELGWVKGADGIRAKGGAKLSLRMPIFGDAAVTKNAAHALQAMLKDKIGVDIVVDERPASDEESTMQGKQYDLLVSHLGGGDPYGPAWMAQMYRSDGPLNITGIGSKEIDAAIDAVLKLPTTEQQIKASNDVEVDIFKLYSQMPIINGITMLAVRNNLANFGASAFGSVPVQDIGWQSVQ